MDAGRLSHQQERFVTEYLVDLNGKQAAIRAGYSEKTADVQASRLLASVKVREAVDKAIANRAEKTGITAERVIEELSKIGFSNMMDYMRPDPDGDLYLDFSNLTRDQAAAIQEVTVEDFKAGRGEDARDVRRVKFKLADKRAALVDIGKHLGLFRERVEHTGKDGGPIQTETMTTSELARKAALLLSREGK